MYLIIYFYWKNLNPGVDNLHTVAYFTEAHSDSFAP